MPPLGVPPSQPMNVFTNLEPPWTSLFSRVGIQASVVGTSDYILCCDWASLVAQRLKHLPGMRDTRVRSLGREDPLEKEMATHPNTIAWRITWREEPGRLQSMGSQRVGHDWATSLFAVIELDLQPLSPPGGGTVSSSPLNTYLVFLLWPAPPRKRRVHRESPC